MTSRRMAHGLEDNRFSPMRIVITGSESVGKTTLGHSLASHYGALCVPEFGRSFTQRKGSPPGPADRDTLARGQIALEEEYLQRARGLGSHLLLHDTDLLSNVAYSHHYFGDCPPAIEQLARDRRAQHYLLLNIDVPWVADGVRDRGDQRQEMHELFVTTLDRLQAPYTVVGGSWAQRFRSAVDLIDTLLSSSATSPSPEPVP